MTYKAFILSLMEHCSPLWAGAPASHLALLDAVENKVLKIIGISHDEPECLGLLLYFGSFSVFYHLLFGLALSALSWLCPSQVFAQYTPSASNSLLVKFPKYRLKRNKLPQSVQPYSRQGPNRPHSFLLP